MLTQQEEKLLQYYRKQLDMPKKNFIFFNGVLWGFLIVFFITLIQYFFDKKSLQQQWEEGMLSRIIVFFLFGLAYGWYNRRTMEKEYKKLKDKEGLS